MTNKLLPCPFCGGKPKKGYNVVVGNWVTCNNKKCGGTIDMRQYMSDAITAWNTRPSPADDHTTNTIHQLAADRSQNGERQP